MARSPARTRSRTESAWHSLMSVAVDQGFTGPGYAERPSRLAGAVVWTSVPSGSGEPVLPDGCMDLLWTDGRLLVAGPDTRAYRPQGPPARWAGIRFHPGTAPAYLGVPA